MKSLTPRRSCLIPRMDPIYLVIIRRQPLLTLTRMERILDRLSLYLLRSLLLNLQRRATLTPLRSCLLEHVISV